MKQTSKSLISQLISASVFSEKPGDSRFSSADREKRQKNESPAETGRVGRSAILIDDLAKSEAAKAAKPGLEINANPLTNGQQFSTIRYLKCAEVARHA